MQLFREYAIKYKLNKKKKKIETKIINSKSLFRIIFLKNAYGVFKGQRNKLHYMVDLRPHETPQHKEEN